MNLRHTVVFLLFSLLPAALPGQSTPLPVARFHTTLGDIDVTLLQSQAPMTVANFLNYVNRGNFDNSLIHRSVPSFIIQGGGYNVVNNTFVKIPTDPAVKNEFGVSNIRGTLAMAKADGDPNSATDQWFFNVIDNSKTLNTQNGGFTVFGRITNAAGLAVMDAINNLPTPTGVYQSPFDQIPLIDYTAGTPQAANLVIVQTIRVLPQGPAIGTNGVISATAFGGSATATAGSHIEIYGSNLAGGTSRTWADSDFKDGKAPTSLDDVSVTVDGQAAYVTFISATQVNAQVPASVRSDGAVSVVVTYNGQASAAGKLTLAPLAPGILAPASFNVDGKQYVAATHSAGGQFVSSGNIPGTTASPAVPGETVTFYGIGFGPVDQSATPIAGQIVQGPTTLSTAVQFNIGSSSAQVSYAGLAPGLVGLYQFNAVIPANSPGGDQPVVVTLGGNAIPQTLWIAVQGKS